MVRLSMIISVCTAATLLCGCGGGSRREAAITVYPNWEFQNYERIAVLPTKVSDRKAADAAGVLNDRLTELLSGAKQFEVLSRAELKDVLTEQDLARLTDVADPSTALPEGQVRIAEALVVTQITEFRLSKDRVERSRPVYGRDRRGRVIQTGEERYFEYTESVSVSGNVRVVDAATGEVLTSYSSSPIRLQDSRKNEPPKRRAEDMAASAARELALDFYRNVAPQRVAIRLERDMIFVATDEFDGFGQTDRLSDSNETFLVVVMDLPPACDRNKFRVAVSAEEGEANLFSEEFIWSGQATASGLSWEVPMSALAATGAKRFNLKMYSGKSMEPMLTRPFELVTLKEGQEIKVKRRSPRVQPDDDFKTESLEKERDDDK
jgi:hypothetical protein